MYMYLFFLFVCLLVAPTGSFHGSRLAVRRTHDLSLVYEYDYIYVYIYICMSI